jgi:hypothetical protein
MLAACGAPKAEAPRKSVTIMSALPLFWGDGDADPKAVLTNPDHRAPVILAMVETYRVRPVDVIDKAAFTGTDLLIVAQPRILQAQELVDLDGWVRGGGHLLIFADPDLVWPSRLAPGDPRRAPSVTLLDPLFTHWGISLSYDETQSGETEIDGAPLAPQRGGRWTTTASACAAQADALVLTCRIGKGQAVLVADADLLDMRDNEENHKGLMALLARAAG